MIGRIRTALALLLAVGVVASCAAPAAPTAAPTVAKPTAPAAAPAAATKPAAATTAPAVATQSATAATAAPAAAATPAAKVKRGGTLRAGYYNDWSPTLDPHSMTANPFGYELVYDTLVRTTLDVKTGKRTIKPGLAETWDQKDPKTIQMKLRKGVTFHDGSPWNAEVAKWNVDRLRTWQKSAAKTDVGVIDSVEIIDDYTIDLKLKSAPAGILYRLGDAISQRSYMVSKAVVDKEGDDGLARKMVGTGSMTFVDWVASDRMNLKKWDKAWEKGVDGQPMPYIDAAVLRVIREETVGITEMRTGNLDVYGQAEPRSYASVRANPDLELVLFSWLGNVNYLVFNTQKPPFDNVKLRQAAMYALDREAINKGVGQGTGTTAYYYWGPADLGYDESLPRLNYDANKAKQLVAEAGYPNGLDVMHDFYQLELLQRTAEALKQSWDQVGIRATLTGVERTAFVSKLQVANFQSANSWRQWGESDPDAYSSRLTTGGVANFAQFTDPDMDKCMEEARNLVEEAKRAEVYKKCQRIIIEKVPYGEVWFSPYAIVVSKKLKGWEPHWFNRIKLRDVWLDK